MVTLRHDNGDVSIHAPARGATKAEWQARAAVLVSIHAPARGATNPICMVCFFAFGFNPRAREGRDAYQNGDPPLSNSFNPRAREGRDIDDALQQGQIAVSIHAPARGAT